MGLPSAPNLYFSVSGKLLLFIERCQFAKQCIISATQSSSRDEDGERIVQIVSLPGRRRQDDIYIHILLTLCDDNGKLCFFHFRKQQGVKVLGQFPSNQPCDFFPFSIY